MRQACKLLFGAGLLAMLASGGKAQATKVGPPPRVGARPGAPQTGEQGAQAPAFEVDLLWPKPMPNRWILGSAVGVAVDSRDHVFVVNLTDSFNARTEMGSGTNPPTGECCTPAPNVLEFDPEGNLVGHWGGPAPGFEWPEQNHGIAIDKQDNVWIGGSGGTDSRLFKYSHDGKFLMAVGKAVATPAPATAAPTDTAYQGVGGRGRGGRGGRGGAAPKPTIPPNSGSSESFGGAARVSFDVGENEAYVADGTRNRRVAVIDLGTGAIKRFWGAYGAKPDDGTLPAYAPDAPAAKQFATPVACAQRATDGLVYVCDRANDRIQVFKKDGSFVKEKIVAPKTLRAGSVWDIAFSRDPQQKYLYVADGSNMKVRVLDRQSLEELTSFGDGGRYPGEFVGVHSIAVDSKGNIYTAETFEGKRVQRFVFKGVKAVPKNQGVVLPKK